MYDFYVTEYKGKLSQEAFEEVEVKASFFVSRMLLGRKNFSHDEKMAVCAVAEVFTSSQERLQGSGAISENNDGYSVTWGTETAENAVFARAKDAASLYISPCRVVGVVGW